MTAPNLTRRAAKAVRIIYAALTFGAVVAPALLAVVRSAVSLPVMVPPALGYALACASVVAMLAATVVLRPKVPARTREQSVESFWGNTAVRGPAMLVWAVCEASSVLGAVGYLVTGVWACFAASAAAVIALMWHGPGALERVE